MNIYRKLVLFFFFFFFFISIIYSQTIIKGKILDGENKPIEFANVSLHRDSLCVDKVISDSLGDFLLIAEKGNYNIKIHQFGKEIYNKEIELNDDKDLGNIIVDNSMVLKEVTIDGRKKLIEHKIDRMVFNVENSARAVGDAVEALRATPGLQVTEDAIKIVGSAGVTSVMIDGRIVNMSGEQLIGYVKSLQSSQIKSIEVISVPPSKYSAEGTSGLVNIVLKKQKSDTWSAGVSSSYKQTTVSLFTESANFNYKKNRVSISSNINYMVGKIRDEKYTTIKYPYGNFTSDANTDVKISFPSGRLGIDYEITPKWSVGTIYSMFYAKPNIKKINLSKDEINTYQTSKITGRTAEKNAYNFHTTLKTDSVGGKVDLDFDYFNFSGKDNQYFDIYKNKLFDSNNENNSYQDIDSYSVNLDVDHPTKFAKLNYGTRFSFTNINSKLYSDIKQVGFVQNDYFKYDENTQAFFASINKSFGNKFSAMFGLRLENTNFRTNSISTGEKKKSNYTKLFPTAYLQYKPNENNNFYANFMQRISRPNFSDLNPFRIYSSPFEYWQGNPELQPVGINRISLTYDYKGISQTSLQTEFVKKFSDILVFIENKSDIKAMPIEFMSGYILGILENYTYDEKSWLRIGIQGSFGYARFNSKVYPLTPKKEEGFMWAISIYPDFKINNNISTGFDLTYYSRNILTDFSINASKVELDLYFKIKFGSSWNLSMNAKDLLKSKIYNSSIRNNIEMNYIFYNDARSVTIGIDYKFGGKVKINERKNKNTEEANRMSN